MVPGQMDTLPQLSPAGGWETSLCPAAPPAVSSQALPQRGSGQHRASQHDTPAHCSRNPRRPLRLLPAPASSCKPCFPPCCHGSWRSSLQPRHRAPTGTAMQQHFFAPQRSTARSQTGFCKIISDSLCYAETGPHRP